MFDEEEVPAAAARGVYNLLMVYNTDLRALYDKYWCVSMDYKDYRNYAQGVYNLASPWITRIKGNILLAMETSILKRGGSSFLYATHV